MKRVLIALLVAAMFAMSASAQQPKPAQQKPAAPAQSQPSEQQAATQARTASRRERVITGRIIDENNQPVQDAFMMVFPAGLVNTPQTAQLAAKIRTTSTDEQGRFAVENLTPGAYKLMPMIPGYVNAPDADQDLERNYYLTGDSVTLRMMKGGVITGTVTTQSGEPVVGARVRAMPLRDLKGRAMQLDTMNMQQEWKTDDRGVYRIYGLRPGVYVVSAGGKGIIPFATGAYDGDAPTYHPSSMRDTATEITVHTGEEISGTDIRYRSNHGYAISGTATSAGSSGGGPAGFAAITIVLTDATNNSFLGFSIAPMSSGAHAFAFDTVPDGEYFVTAMGTDYQSGGSSPRITVKGGDVAGIDILLVAFSSIEGRVVIEQAPQAARKPECKDARAPMIEEVVIIPRDHDASKDRRGSSAIAALFPFPIDSTPNDGGEFKAGLLEPAKYHIEGRLPSENWYLKSVTLPPEKPGALPKDAARDGLQLKPGQQVKGLTVTIGEGAARLRGRVVPQTEGARLPEALRVHILPAEKESADDALRFYEAAVEGDGSFTMANVAPGRYLVIARPSKETRASSDKSQEPTPVSWDAANRRKLRAEAEAANVAIELQHCQRKTDYVLRYLPQSSETPKKM